MKIKLAFYAIWNIFRLSVLKIFKCGKFKSSLVQFLSPKTEIELGDGGHIALNGRVHSQKNVLLSAKDGGKLTCGKMFINRNSMVVCRDSIIIGDGTTIGPNVVIYDHDHDVKSSGKLVKAQVVIGKNVWIGAGAVILKGVTIGDNAVVAAGTVVSKDVPVGTLVRNQRPLVYKDIQEIV